MRPINYKNEARILTKEFLKHCRMKFGKADCKIQSAMFTINYTNQVQVCGWHGNGIRYGNLKMVFDAYVPIFQADGRRDFKRVSDFYSCEELGNASSHFGREEFFKYQKFLSDLCQGLRPYEK